MTTRSSQEAVTLIECLLVVAIIGILAGLLIPAIAMLKSHANSVACVANLRQQAVLFSLYASDNEGYLPAPQNEVPDSGGQIQSWTAILRPYIQMQYPGQLQKSVILCPEAVRTYPNHRPRATYIMNAQGTDGYTRRKRIRFEKPEASLLVTDAAAAGTDGNCYPALTYSQYRTVTDWRHNGGVNALFIDGHVGAFTAHDLDAFADAVKNFALYH